MTVPKMSTFVPKLRTIPDSVYVCGLRFEIKQVKRLGVYGRCLYRKIIIERGQSRDQERDTVMHECIHAMEAALGMKLTEEQVSQLAHGVVTTLRGNPKLAQYILGEG